MCVSDKVSISVPDWKGKVESGGYTTGHDRLQHQWLQPAQHTSRMTRRVYAPALLVVVAAAVLLDAAGATPGSTARNATNGTLAGCPSLGCAHGLCVNGTCVCEVGWHGVNDWTDSGRCIIHRNTQFILHSLALCLAAFATLYATFWWVREIPCCRCGARVHSLKRSWSMSSRRSRAGSKTADSWTGGSQTGSSEGDAHSGSYMSGEAEAPKVVQAKPKLTAAQSKVCAVK